MRQDSHRESNETLKYITIILNAYTKSTTPDTEQQQEVCWRNHEETEIFLLQ